MVAQSKVQTWTGRAITALVVLMLTFSAVMKLSNHPEVTKQFVGAFGYPEDLPRVIGVVEIACVVIYLVPQTAVLGAVLLTGYLGGAIATHVRVHDNFIGAAVGGVLVWLGVYLRDPRVRALLPLRRKTAAGEPIQ